MFLENNLATRLSTVDVSEDHRQDEWVVDDEAVDAAPDVSVVTADAPLLPHVPAAAASASFVAHVSPATARKAPTRQDLKRARELGKVWVMAALGKADATN